MGVAWGREGGREETECCELGQVTFLDWLRHWLSKSPSNAPPQPCSDLPSPSPAGTWSGGIWLPF